MIIAPTGSTVWHQAHININGFTNTVRRITSLSLCFAFIAHFLSFQRPADVQENSMTSSRQLLILEPASISNSNVNSMAIAKRNKEENKKKKKRKISRCLCIPKHKQIYKRRYDSMAELWSNAWKNF